jgi:hypothetical protein
VLISIGDRADPATKRTAIGAIEAVFRPISELDCVHKPAIGAIEDGEQRGAEKRIFFFLSDSFPNRKKQPQ